MYFRKCILYLNTPYTNNSLSILFAQCVCVFYLHLYFRGRVQLYARYIFTYARYVYFIYTCISEAAYSFTRVTYLLMRGMCILFTLVFQRPRTALRALHIYM